MAGIFKAYDIRGIYGKTLTESIATDIGRAVATFLGCRKVVVGRDMRPHSPGLFEALCRGLTLQGADVIDVGLVSTCMTYYGNGSLGADASIMITAATPIMIPNMVKSERSLLETRLFQAALSTSFIFQNQQNLISIERLLLHPFPMIVNLL